MKKLDNSVCLEDFGRLIRSRREQLELSQEEVAVMVGIHRTYYGKIENAGRVVDLVVAMKICQALKLDLSDFIKTHI